MRLGDVELDNYGFRWGNMIVHRAMSEPTRGRVLTVGVVGKDRASIEVYVSNGGRSVRVFRDGVELVDPT